jgi:hypothetical protein
VIVAVRDFSANAKHLVNLAAGVPSTDFASNLHTTLHLLEAGGVAMPVTLNGKHARQTWVCSPRTTYSHCISEEAVRYVPSYLAHAAKTLFSALGSALDFADIDQIAALNNWTLSTNIYPPLTKVNLPALIGAARERWPSYALWFRSLNQADNGTWLAALQQHGFQLIASRQVYVYDDFPALIKRHENLQRDLRALAKTSYSRTGDSSIEAADYARIAELYRLLYTEKYSAFNPQYSALFMQRWHQAGLLEFDGLRDAHGQLQGIFGGFSQAGVLSAPIVGYNTALPVRAGLYRLVTACAFQAAMRRAERLNFSAGAAEFKRLRGGKATMEFSAVYAPHLPLRTRLAIRTLSLLSVKMGAPLMAKYEL